MPPLNPFLRAFFRSALPPQCSPVHQHVLLVPTTEVLLTSRDRETQALYSDLASSEDFLASHVLRIHTGAGGAPLTAQGKEVSSFRETRTKAKQFTTLNGRTVIIKDSFVYSNKGFKCLNQAQLLSDSLYYPDAADAQPWLVYYISRPLVGIYDAVSIIPATPDMAAMKRMTRQVSVAEPSAPKKKDIKSFNDVLNNFPMIAKQMQPGLERLFKEFALELQKPLPPTPSSVSGPSFRDRANSASSGDTTLAASFHSSLSNGSIMPKPTIFLNDEEDALRKTLETAVTAAIDLFQMVDKQQLSQLGASTDLTGPVVERMIERYIAEQVHDALLFSRICASRKAEDADLEGRIRQMTDIDITQVGLSGEGSSAQRRELLTRLSKAATLFKRMGVASSPQETTEILLSTLKVLSEDSSESIVLTNGATTTKDPEKHSALLTVNADTLVSMLLIVVIRSTVRHLNARLSYMRHFSFIDDVEGGELGYALSTFEAVLSYLTRDSAILRKASRTNRKVWDAVKCGDLRELRQLLERDDTQDHQSSRAPISGAEVNGGPVEPVSFSLEDLEGSRYDPVEEPDGQDGTSDGLTHVFPFQRTPTPDPASLPKRKKRVSVASFSTSSSSVKSFHTRTDSLHSRLGDLDTELSGPALAKTHSADGESLLMMAVENVQPSIVGFLTSWHAAPPLADVLDDTNNDGTTLLSAAVQTGRDEVASALLDFILEHPDLGAHFDRLASYVAQPDTKGRSAAHYLFNTPRLIKKLGNMLPWTLKDRNGQTPLFALCRSYDHDDYRYMVETALAAATRAQADSRILHVDDHIDSKGNTLLHILNDPEMIIHLLQQCDSNVNAANDKHFTPLMVASKYGRTDTVRILFADARVNLFAKDLRGLTAVELAKDDEIRNRIDDLVLLSTPASSGGRITAVVRSFFVEDGTVRLILKSGAPNQNSTITVTTSRRTPIDFEALSRLLALELPASWLPVLSHPQSPFLVPSKPSRALLRDMQLKLDSFLHILLAHPTFATHEMVWEFFLVPDIDPAMLAERAKKKAETRAEMVRDEYEPISEVREVELFVSHAKESVRGFHHATRSVIRRINRVRHVQSDFVNAAQLCKTTVSTLVDLPNSHITALDRFTKTLGQTDFSPYNQFFYAVTALQMTTSAVLTALNRPSTLIGSMSGVQKSIDKHMQSLRRSDRWPLGLLDDTRSRLQKEAQDKADKSLSELRSLGQELRYTQQTIAGELAGWQDEKAKMGRRAIKELARRMVVAERDRLEGMRRAIRGLDIKERPRRPPK